jgi:hypothetical protein
MDLPENVTLCKNYNFVIIGKNAGGAYDNPNLYIDFADATWSTGVGFNNAEIAGFNVDDSSGPVNVTRVTNADINGATVAGGNMAFLVKGTSGQRRITIYALGEAAGATITVETDFKLNIKLFDGLAHSDIDTLAINETGIALDLDGDGVYGNLEADGDDIDEDEVIGGDVTTNVTADEPYVENTLCVNAVSMSGQYLYTSYASKGDKFTFTGDSQIAHTGTAATIALASCKGETTDTIEIGGGQNAACVFEYDDAGDYCDTSFENRLLIEASSGAFGDIGDKFFVELEITSPNDGVYFGGLPVIRAYKSTEDPCDDPGTLRGSTWSVWEGSTRITSFAADTDCAVGADGRATKMAETDTFTLTDYDTIWIDLAEFTYTSAAVAAGEVVTLDVTLSRYPCGEIFNDTLDIGSFVTTCAGSGATTLYFPWLPGTAATGWWGGFVITNIGNTDGVATLTYSDSTGAQATLVTSTVVAGAQWVNTAVTADDLTDVSGFDMSLNHSVTAACGFAARGFAFTGNGTEGTGYLANGTGTGNW